MSAASRASARDVARPPGAAAALGDDWVDRRLARVADEVHQRQAHFGLWIDGAGETCRLVDERGHAVAGLTLLAALARYVCSQAPRAAIVIEPPVPLPLAQALGELGARAIPGGATREAMAATIQSSEALLGGGASGRFWFGARPAAPDSLMALSLLLALLSQSDRPFSEVLDSGAVAL